MNFTVHAFKSSLRWPDETGERLCKHIHFLSFQGGCVRVREAPQNVVLLEIRNALLLRAGSPRSSASAYLVLQSLPSPTHPPPPSAECDCFVWKKKSKVYNKGRTVSADFHLHTFSYILVKIIDEWRAGLRGVRGKRRLRRYRFWGVENMSFPPTPVTLFIF